MAKITIPQGLTGKALASFLVANKEALIAQKKAMPIKYAEPFSHTPSLYQVKEGQIVKALAGEAPQLEDEDVIRVKVVANASGWCDSHMDVLLADCWKKSIRERKGLIPHLHDHTHTIDAEIGDVISVHSEDISLTDLGLNQPGKTQCLIFETDIKKAYNEKVFNKYKAGKIKQHSIGLQYVRLDLAINDEDSEKEYDFWQKHIDQVINKEFVEEQGFFWVVQEIKVLENSAVLFGSNILTPTLGTKSNDTDDAPPSGTQQQPSIHADFIKNLKLV